MHILFTTPAYSPFPGGGERYAAALATQLTGRGHRVTVLTSTATRESDLWLGSERITTGIYSTVGPHVIRCPIQPMPGGRKALLAWRKAMILISAFPGSQSRILLRMANRIPAILGMSETLSSLQPRVDLVHSFNISWEHSLVVGWRYAVSRAIPFVVTPFAHLGSDGQDRVALNSTMDHQRLMMSDANALVVLTSIEADWLRQIGAVPAEPDAVSVIGAGLDPLPPAFDGQDAISRYGIAKPFAIFVGRNNFDKGAIHAAQTIIALNKQGLAVNLVLVGQITEEFDNFYKRLASDVRAVIQPLGFLDEVEKHDLLEKCSFLMLPSRTDSFGIVLLEAWAHGKPVIGSTAGGIPGVVDEGENGFLLQFGDVRGMTEVASLLFTNNTLNHRMGAAGRKKVTTQYNWEPITDKLLSVYRSVLNQF